MNGYKKGRREHSSDVVKSAANALSSAQKSDRKGLTSKDAILSIKKNVLAARSRGMTWEEIAEIVQAAGLPVAVSTLKKVIGPSKPAPAPAPAAAPMAAPAPTAGKVGERIRAEKAAAPAVAGVAETTQVKMNGRGGFEIRPMVDDI